MRIKEKRTKWKFATDDDGTWLWSAMHPDGDEAESTRTFPTLSDCIADATRHGYVIWGERERRTVH